MSWTDTRRLHQLVEKLQEQMHESATCSAILITLNELNSYAEKVFEQEEVFLSSMRGLDIKSRQTLHKRLLKQLALHTQNFKDDPTPKVLAEFMDFLQAWVQLQEKTLVAMSEGREPN